MKRFLVTLVIVFLLVVSIIGGTISFLLYFDRENGVQKLVEAQGQIASLQNEVDNKTVQVAELEEELEEALSGDSAVECYSQSSDGWVVVNTPCQNGVLEDSFVLKGVAFGLFENNLEYSLETTEGEVLTTGSLTYDAPDLGLPGLYNEIINWSKPADREDEEVVLYVFGTSAEDGSREHVVTINVVL